MRVYFIRRFNRAWSQRTLNNKLYASITNIIPSIHPDLHFIDMDHIIWFGLVTTRRFHVERYVNSLRVEHTLVISFNVLVNRTFYPTQSYRKLLIHLKKAMRDLLACGSISPIWYRVGSKMQWTHSIEFMTFE